MTDDEYREFAKDGVSRFSRRPLDEAVWQTFAESLFFVTASLDDPRAFAPLGSRLDIDRARARPARQPHLLPRGAAVDVRADRRSSSRTRKFVGPPGEAKPFARLIVEKPIGHDLDERPAPSTTRSPQVFDERQIYRIDHYLGKETVQNILVLRFANSIFEPLFNQKYIDHVQITVAEEEGVGTRAGYYEQAGALRDMVQNHMLQLLTLVGDGAAALARRGRGSRREARGASSRLRPMTRRRRRSAGRPRPVRAPASSMGSPGARVSRGGRASNPKSRTETFVALQLFIDNWRWAGVPFFLRTGKRLPKRASEISIHLKDVPPILFNANRSAPLEPNVLSIRIQPDEGFALGDQLEDARARACASIR